MTELNEEFVLPRRSAWDASVIGFGLTLAILVVAGILGSVNLERLAEDRRVVMQSHAIIAALESTLSALKDAETGQRGYLLTGDASYLQPYDDARQRIPRELDELEHLVSADRQQREAFDALKQHAQAKLDELARTVELARSGKRSEAVDAVRAGSGKQSMNAMRASVIAMESEEQATLENSRDLADAGQRTVLWSILLPAFIGILLVITFFALVRRTMRLRAHATETISEQRERLRTTLASIGDGVISTDLQGRITNMNAVAESLTGWTNDAARGQPLENVFRIVSEETHEPVENPAARALSEGVVVGLGNHAMLVAKDGTERFIDDSASPIRSTAGKLVGCVLIFRDVSQRRLIDIALADDFRAMARLQSLSTRLARTGEMDEIVREILAASCDLTNTTKGTIHLVDPSTGRLRVAMLLGFGPRFVERFGEHGSAIICDACVRARERVFWEDLEAAPELTGTPDLEAYLGDDVRAITCTPLLTRDGRLLGLLNNKFPRPHRPSEHEQRYLDLLARMAADLIERSQHEHSLRDADRRKNEFLAMLAHELRNPLAPIQNALQILHQHVRTGSDEVAITAAAMMERQLAQLVRLVDDLLDVSRVSRGKIELKKSKVELASIVNLAVEAAHPLRQSREHALSVTLPDGPVFVNADPARLAQVVGNLLANAFKFTEPGGRVELSVARDGDQAVIRVHDNGMGIAPDHLARIFELFMQVDTSLERAQGGLGIGLTLCKKLVEMHDGAIEARSDGVGCGSEFIVRMPVAAPVSDTKAARSRGDGAFAEASKRDEGALGQTAKRGDDALGHTAKRGDAALLSGRRILVVDDNRDSAESLAMLLRLHGNETQTAFDGVEAVAAAESFRPELILSDIGLPRMNGYEVARKIRERAWGKELVLIALTGWGQEADRQRSSAAGFDGHLVKPVELSQLTNLVALVHSRRNSLA
jgi:PAS domain S-box-containing protein